MYFNVFSLCQFVFEETGSQRVHRKCSILYLSLQFLIIDKIFDWSMKTTLYITSTFRTETMNWPRHQNIKNCLRESDTFPLLSRLEYSDLMYWVNFVNNLMDHTSFEFHRTTTRLFSTDHVSFEHRRTTTTTTTDDGDDDDLLRVVFQNTLLTQTSTSTSLKITITHNGK